MRGFPILASPSTYNRAGCHSQNYDSSTIENMGERIVHPLLAMKKLLWLPLRSCEEWEWPRLLNFHTHSSPPDENTHPSPPESIENGSSTIQGESATYAFFEAWEWEEKGVTPLSTPCTVHIILWYSSIQSMIKMEYNVIHTYPQLVGFPPPQNK